MSKLKEVLSEIEPGDQEAAAACQKHLDHIAKPLGSLGELENILCMIARAQGSPDISVEKKCVLVYCSDNGIVAQGVAQSDHSVTTSIARSLAAGHSSVCVMAASCGADTFPIDVGMVDTVPEIRERKVARGTDDFSEGPAMAREEAEKAIMAGVESAVEMGRKGYDIIATGEAGIGNTSSSSAVASVLLGLDPEIVTGRGSGLTDGGLRRKIAAIRRGIAINSPDWGDPVDVLAKVGGFDICAMCGTFIGGALSHTPVVIDGLISSVAALCAFRLSPVVRDYMIPSHKSGEPAAEHIMEELNFTPILDAGMRLGEGSGAVTLFPVIDMAASVYRNAAVFEEINVQQYRRLS